MVVYSHCLEVKYSTRLERRTHTKLDGGHVVFLCCLLLSMFLSCGQRRCSRLPPKSHTADNMNVLLKKIVILTKFLYVNVSVNILSTVNVRKTICSRVTTTSTEGRHEHRRRRFKSSGVIP